MGPMDYLITTRLDYTLFILSFPLYRGNAVLNFLMRLGIGFANYADNKMMMEIMLGADRIPLTLLIDTKGKVLKKVRG